MLTQRVVSALRLLGHNGMGGWATSKSDTWNDHYLSQNQKERVRIHAFLLPESATSDSINRPAPTRSRPYLRWRIGGGALRQRLLAEPFTRLMSV